MNASLSMDDSSRIALAGANGTGKSTLMKLLAGLMAPDGGEISRSPGARVRYLPQSGMVYRGRTLREEAEDAFGELHDMVARFEQLSEILVENPHDEAALTELGELQHMVEESRYYERERHIGQVLSGLGFSEADFARDTSEFSGGWQMRIALAKLLLADADFLLLDEPTNYLDIDAREWLLEYLASFHGGVMLVSHDRYFMDRMCSEVAELFLSRLTVYKGNYSRYEKRREEELAELQKRYEEQQAEIQKLESFISRFRYNASKASLVQSRIKQLEKIDRIELPDHLKPVHIRFPSPPHSGKHVVRLNDVERSYGDVEVLRDVNLEVERGERVALIGANGAGKSTLMRIIAAQDPEFSGEMKDGSDVVRGYFAQDSAEALVGAQSILEEVEAHAPSELMPKIRDLLGSFLFRGDDVYKPLDVLSGGEKTRVALLKLLLSPSNLLILDEPTNHLDITSKDVLLGALAQWSGTLVFVSHDRHFIARLATSIVRLESQERGASRMTVYPGGWDYFEWMTRKEDGESGNIRADGSGSAGASGGADESGKAGNVNPTGKRAHAHIKAQRSRIAKLEKTEASLLQRTEEIEADLAELQEQMSRPENYRDGERMREMQQALAQGRETHERLLQEWESVDAELSELKGD